MIWQRLLQPTGRFRRRSLRWVVRLRMKAAQILKLAVVGEIALIPIGVGVSFWADTFLSRDVLAFKESQSNAFTSLHPISPGMIGLMLGGTVMFGVWVAALIGLLKLKRWGAWLYLLTTLFALPLYFTFGIDIRHPIDQIFDVIHCFIPGLIIGLAFFSDAIPQKYSEQTGSSNGG